MWRQLAGVLVGVIFCSAASAADDQKTEIKGGIEAKVKKVDVDAKTLTVTTEQGRVRTFTINDETTMVGPRGGKVRRGLKDPRFHEGLSVTIVAEGNTATEVHLGYDRGAAARVGEKVKEKVSEGKEAAALAGEKAKEKIGEGKEAAARAGEKVKEKVSEARGQGQARRGRRGQRSPRQDQEI
jgi:hypothetical protein